MKKIIALLLSVATIMLFVGCGDNNNNNDNKKEADIFTKSEGVMTYSEYAAAKDDDPVVIEAFVQAKQSWWNNKATIYLADDKGAYFVYELTCTEDDYNNKLTIGSKIKVTGYKTSWAGEVEVASGATWELEEGTYTATAKDLTSKFGTEELINYQNQLFTVKDAVVADYDGNGNAFAYKDAEGKTDDLYFTLLIDGVKFDFCVEFYLCGKDTDVYKAVEALQVGDVVDVEGFLYWYNGANPHTTKITKKSNVFTKSQGVMTYAQYDAAAIDDEVVIEAFIQAKQSWWNNKATIYLADDQGAYFVYELTCTEDDYNNKLTIGSKIKVTGYKTAWAEEVEVASGATWEAVESQKFIVTAKDLTSKFGTEGLIDYQNQLFAVKNAEVVDYDGEGNAFAYKDAEGKTDDLYFKLKIGDATYDFCVEFYLCGKDTDVYKAVEALQVGDKVNVEGFLYWYNGANPHTTKITKVAK